MTINSTSAASGPYVGTGEQQTLPFDFHAASIDEVSVVVDNQPVDGFVVVLEDDGTGSVIGTFAAGGIVYIESDPSFIQDTDFARFAPYFPDSLNPPLDRAAIRDIALKGKVDRSLIAPIGAGDPVEYFRDIGFRGLPGIPGVGGNTFLTLASLKALDPTKYQAASLADGLNPAVNFAYVAGNFTGRADDVNVVKLDAVPLTIGALVRQTTATISYRRPSAVAVAQPASATLDAYAVTAEQFGAVGDGITDDAPAIQRALDYIASVAAATNNQTRPGVLLLSPGRWYKCGSALTWSASRVSMTGYATLDFSSWSGKYATITGSPSEFGNGYGRHGCFEGAIALIGSGAGNAGVGITYENNQSGGNARVRTVGISVTKCGVGVRFGARGYNQLLLNCQIFDCGTLVDWPGDTPDADERNALIGCDLYNSSLAINHARAAGNLSLTACSIDYVNRVWNLTSGKIKADTCHFEASNWGDRPFNTNDGDAVAVLNGGWIVQQQNFGNATNLFYVGAGAAVKLRDVLTNNTNNLSTPNNTTPTTWATGPGRFEMTGSEPAFEFGGFPARLHSSYSVLSDGEFERPLGEDLLWLREDTQPITSRYTGTNLSLSRATVNQYDGSGCLRVDKQFGPGSPAAFVLVAIPVRYGDKVTGGFRVRSAPDRAGADRRLIVRSGFAKLDGFDANRVPIIARFSPPGEMTVTPVTTGYTLVTPYNGKSQITAPSWATHWIIDINAFQADQASWCFDGAWADRW